MPPRVGSAADISERVGRLEVEVALTRAEQTHLRELMMSQYSGLKTAIDVVQQELKNIALSISGAMADPASTPAGRMGLTRLNEAVGRIEQTEADIEKLAKEFHERRAAENAVLSIFRWLGVLGIALVLMAFVAFGLQLTGAFHLIPLSK